MNTAILQSPWLEQLGWTLLHFLWQGVLVASLLAATLAGLRGCAARTRYLVSVAAALAAGLLPLATFLLLPLPLPASSTGAPLQAKGAYPAAPASVRPAVPVSMPVSPSAEPTVAQPTPARQPTHPPSPIQNQDVPTLSRIYSTLASEARPWLPWLAAAWTLGVVGLSFRLLTGWTQVQRLRRHGVELADVRWQARLQTLAARLGVRRAVRLLESTLAEVPAVIGWLRPVILLPVGVLAGLSTIQVEMILAHELAHIRRQDYLVNLGLALFETLGFYHPAVWWIARCVRIEREHVCDDLAVSAGGGDRLGYVRALATLEEMRGPAGQFALAASGGGRGLLLARVRRLLGITVERRPRAGRATWWLAGIITLLSALAITLGGVQRPALAQEVPPKKQPPAPESLRGRVVDEAGRPVEGALVYDNASHDGTIEYPPGPLVTDADGAFRVPKQRFPGQWRFIGARLGDSSVGWLDIGAGRQPAAFGVDNVLTRPLVLRSRRFALRGTCVDEAGQPVAGATVAVTSLPVEGSDRFNWQPNHPEESIYHFWEALTTRSDAAGNFSLPVPLEEGMSVEIRARGRQTVEPFQTVKAGVPPLTDLGRVTLAPAGSIAGQIFFQPADGGEPRPLKDAFLQAVNVAEVTKADFLGPKEYGNVPDSDAQGRYAIEHLPPGTYTVYFFGLDPEDPSKEPVRMAAVENVAVHAGETTALDLRAVPGKRLRVRAEDPVTHQPARDLAVHFVGPSRPASSGLNMGAALHQGEWTLEVAPGHYRVFLSSGYGPNSPEVASAEVDVPADRDPDSVLLQVKTEPHLRGKVQDARGKFIPLGSASVVLLETSPASGRQEAGGQSSNGTFDIPLTRAGYRARLVVDVPGYRAFVSPEFVVAERPEPMTVTLEEVRTLTVTGRALDQDGKPMARAYVSGQIVVGDGLHYNVRLGNGIPDIELHTDEDGHFETRRFRGGDHFQVFVYGKDGAVSESADWPWTHPQEGDSYRLDMKARPAIRPPTAEAPVGPRDLVGHVVDAQGKPVAGATVTFDTTSPGAGAATTNAEGGFRFPDFGGRHYLYLAVAKEGYATHWETDLTVGQDFTVRLDDRTRLRGQLRLPDGTRASYARLILRTSRPTKRPFMANPIGNLRLDRQADLQGSYDFPAEPGEYEVQIASADGSFVARHDGVQVVAGQVNTLPTALKAALTLRVQAVDRVTGQPAAGVKFAIWEMSDAAAMEIRPGSRKQTDAQGFAQWDGLLPGTVELNTRENDVYQRVWSRDARQTYPEKFPVDRPPQGNESSLGQLMLKLDPARADEPVVMQVERGVKVSGEIVDAAGKPAINVQLRATVDRTGQKDGQPSGDLVPFYAYEQDGALHAYLPAGNGLPTRVDAYPQDIGQGVTLSDPFDSQPGDERHLTIRLHRGATAEGRVVDAEGKGLTNVNVAATPLDHLDSFAFTPWATTDAQGRFRFEHVRPTEYEVTTTIVPHLSVGKEPPQEKRRFTVADGEHARLGELHFVPAGWTGSAADTPIGPRDLAGHVVDAQGSPIEGVLITANGKYPAPSPVTTDAQGRFRFVDYGEVRHVGLIADMAGYGTRHLVDVSTGRDLEVRLENTTRLRGKFLRPDGAAAGSATITLFANRITRSPEEIHTSSHGFTLTTDERGDYDIPVEPGEYDVEILADRENLVARHEKFTVPADRATALPEGLQPGLELHIQTVDSVTGRPAPGARFYLRDQRNVAAFGPRPGSERQTDARGFARWDHLFPGPVFVDVDRDPVYARFWSTDKREHHHDAVRASPHPTRDQGADGSLYIDVLPDRGEDPVVVQTERGVVVSGRVLDPQSRPVGGVQIDVLMSGPGGTPDAETVYGLTGFPNSTVTAADGTFSSWCIPAGNGGQTYLVADDHLNTPGYTLGNGHSDPFPSAPGDKREVYIRLTTGGYIEGSVVDARGQPLANIPIAAAVLDHLDGYANHIGPTTDAQGHFRIGPLRPAEYDVRARGADWDWDHPEPPEEKRRVTVAAGETVQTGPLHFDPAGWTAPPTSTPMAKPSAGSDSEGIVGRVVDAQGNGVPDAEVFDLDYRFDRPADASPLPPVRTDAAGGFRLPAAVRYHPLVARTGDQAIGWASIDGNKSPTITLRACTAALDGEILDPAGQPVEGVRVQITSVDGGGTSTMPNRGYFPNASTERLWSLLAATSDARGRFRLPLPEGAARSLDVTHLSYVSQHLREIPADGHLGRLTLAPGGRVSGHVFLSPENAPFPQAEVWASKAGDKGQGGYIRGNARTGADGSYLIDGLEPGEYAITLGAHWHRPRGRAAVAIEHIIVRAGETTADTDLRAVEGRTINVEVVDAITGQARIGAQVVCFGPSEPHTGLNSRVGVQGDGRAKFVVAPGTYECRVVSLTGNEPNGRTVEVSADPAVPVPTVRLSAGKDTRVHGVVRMKDGSPVPEGTEIDLVWLPGERTRDSHSIRTSDRNGNGLRYVYDGLGDGSHVTVVVDAPGCKTWRSEVLTVGANLPELLATLEPAAVAPLRGSVIDPAGNPAVGAVVRATLELEEGEQHSLSLGPDGKQLRTDAQGRFETRRLRVGDTFSLWAHDEHDARGQLLITYTDPPPDDRRQARSPQLTIRDADGLDAPTLRLEPLAPIIHSKHSGSLDDPYNAEDRQQQLKNLTALDRVDDPRAAPMLHIVFMSLNEHAPGQPPDAAEQAVLARFLDADNPDVLAPAMKAFRMVNDPATLAKLKAALPRLATRPDDALWLAERLRLLGDDEPLGWIAARLRDPATPGTQRRVWSFRLLPSAPHRFAPLYVDLLTDADAAVRANALGRLKAWTDGDDFGFDPARGMNGQAAGLARWRGWLEKSGDTLPEQSLPPAVQPNPSTGWLGLILGDEPDGSGPHVIEAVSGGPARRAGVQAQDVIATVDGRSAAGRTSSEVIARGLAGAVGTPVKLTIRRVGKPDPVEITVVREARPTPTPPPVKPDGASMETNSSNPPTASPTPPAARTLVFRVAERGTNKPVPGAGLRINGDGSGEKSAHTDAAGVCIIPLPETPHFLSVRVKKPGFVPMRVDWSLTQPAFHLPAEYTLTLEPGTTIGGTVLNEDDQPVANAAVVLILRGSNSGGTEEVFPDIWEERVTTDARGRWTYDAAPSALRYPSITVEHPDYVRHDHTDLTDRLAVENLRDGSALLRLRRGIRVEGRVTDPAGHPIAGAVILPGNDRMDSTTKPEYHTDADGRFVVAHTLPGAETLTVKAEGHAPEIIDASFSPGMEPLHITLQPGRVLRVRVIDAEGKRLAGVTAAADTWRKRRTLETCLESDAAGRIEWKSAPPDAVQYDFLKEGYQAARGVVLTAAADEQTITLRRPLLVSGTVTDARTGHPLREFRLIPGVATPENHRLWARDAGRPGNDGRYVQAFDEPAALAGQHLLRVEAEGYHSAVSRRIDDAEGNVTLDFSVEPGDGSKGRVLAPDGSPAAGAKIAVAFPGDPVSVQDGVLQHRADHVEAVADAQGHFQFPSQEPPYLVVVAHPAGYARLTAEEFVSHPDVGLTAWGRVEVAVPPTASPASGHRLPFYLADRTADGSEPTGDQPIVYFEHTARLAENGGAVLFDKVSPGDWRLGRYGQANDYARPLRVSAGETTHLSLIGERSITGRLNTATVHEAMDLTQCRVQVSLKTPPPPVPEGLAVAERQAWFKEWFQTDAGKAYQAAARTYHGEMTEDGVFRCDGVPSGKEYELRIMLLEAGQDPQQPRLVLYYSKQFLLPEGTEADDLGEVQAQSPTAQGK